ncbi:MAG TPA: glucodextranase DOMON-like domain-containing protein [Thermoanaerobaculia bacterium]|nr:glucodextranase DOMON-like domain-containing protein [Thermoanaerobaculia bacterium]
MTSRPPCLRRGAAVLAALLPLLAPRTAGADDGALFVVTDPERDDHGDGHLTYPVRSRNDMLPGHLDLVSFAARREGDGTMFEVTFARPVVKTEKVPLDGGGTLMTDVMRLGFYTFNVDVYVDVDRVPGSGNTETLPGRNAEVDPADAWEKAICLTPLPGPAETLLRRSLTQRMRKESAAGPARPRDARETEKAEIRDEVTQMLADSVFFPTRVEIRGRRVRFFVPDHFLGGPPSADWGYVVAVSGADVAGRYDLGKLAGLKRDDGDEPLFIMRAGAGRSSDAFGGADEDDRKPCPLVDILVPPGTTQEKVLGDFDPREGRRVRLPAVVPSALARGATK